MHADHLGDCPAPAPNSILSDSPADWMERSSNGDEADQRESVIERRSMEETPCFSDCSSEEEEESEVRERIKRKKKNQVRKAPELTDSECEEQEGRGNRVKGSERKPASGHLTKEKMPNLTDSSADEAEGVEEGEAEESKGSTVLNNLTKEKIPYLTKKIQEPPILTDSSADEAEGGEEDEAEEGKGGSTVFNNLTKNKIPHLTKEEIPHLTNKKIQEPPSLTDSSDEEEEVIQGDPFCGSMRGGASSSLKEILDWVDQIQLAILGHHPPLKLDELTPGLGDCFSEAIVQQCQRPPIKLYLQSRGITISNMLQLKAKVAEFVNVNKKARKLQDLRVNFEASQLNMRHEGLPARTWREYWADMQRSGPWADDHFIQCTAWYLNARLSILYVGSETEGKTTTSIDGQFFPSAPGESQPVMYLGYIVNTHYQSLLPQVEDNTMPAWLAPPAIDNTLQRTLQCLQSMQQGSQVSKVAQAVNIFSYSLLQAQASVPISHDTPNQSCGNDQVRMDS